MKKTSGHILHQRFADFVSLQAVRPQARHFNLSAQGVQSIEECGLRPVSFHCDTCGTVALSAGHDKSSGFLPNDPNAEGFQRFQRHVHIAFAFEGRKDFDHAAFIQKRQGKQQAGNKLAAHVAAHSIYARLKTAFHGHGILFMNKGHAPAFQQFLINAYAPGHQPFRTAKSTTAVAQCKRHHKTQRTSAFPAGKHRQGIPRSKLSAAALYEQAAVFFPNFRAQRLNTVHGGQNILTHGRTVDAAFPRRQRRTDQQPVRAALGGRRRNSSTGHPRLNDCFHLSLPPLPWGFIA